MVNHLQPGQQGLIELGQGGHLSLFKFGQKIGLDELEKAFDTCTCAASAGVLPRPSG